MAPQSFQLVMRSGPTPGKTFVLDKGEIMIGRDTTNDVVINDAEVSRKHSRLTLQGGGYILEDLGSTNGTFIDGQRLMGPHTMRPGELIMLGENISLSYDAVQFDPNATVVASAPMPREVPPPPTAREELPEPLRPVAPPPAFSTPTPSAPVYAGQVPPGPVEEFEVPAAAAPPKKSNSRTWLLAGCGCLILLLCCLVVAGIAFDQMRLYCTPPFDSIFRAIGYCQ
jgi:predicted component of type VI protein secretion system